MSLPLAPAAVEVARGVAPSADGASLDVLVIDDNVDAAHTVAEMLELMGHRVHVATDGKSGVEKARAVQPSVIICDIGLPDIHGYEVARAVRRDGALRAVRLVAVSGYAQPEDRQRAREAGFDAHLAKPASAEDLIASLSPAVDHLPADGWR